MNWSRIHRKLHSWAAVITAVPLFVIIATGLLLQVKKEFSWIQPPTQRGSGKVPTVSFDQLLAAAQTAKVQSWADIDRVDLRPAQGVAKLHTKDGWEVQVDMQTGAVLQTAFRRSDFIESMHDGSFFHSAAKLWVFLPCGALLLLLWLTGLYMWVAPRLTRFFRKRSALSPNSI